MEKSVKEKKRANDLDGKTWVRYSISVWSDLQKNSRERALHHPALFPVTLVERIMQMFSHKDELVLDPFMGSGSTLIGAARLGRKAIGLEISGEYTALFKNRMQEENLSPSGIKIFQDDARRLQKYVAPGSVALCLTSPPYWNILREKRTADHKSLRNYGDSGDDLGNIADYPLFLQAIKEIFAQVFYALKDGGYCVLVVMDLRKKEKFYPLHLDLSAGLTSLGFLLDDIIIWDRRAEYNRLRPLGYPYVFRINKVHEYILIFRKPVLRKGGAV